MRTARDVSIAITFEYCGDCSDIFLRSLTISVTVQIRRFCGFLNVEVRTAIFFDYCGDCPDRFLQVLLFLL